MNRPSWPLFLRTVSTKFSFVLKIPCSKTSGFSCLLDEISASFQPYVECTTRSSKTLSIWPLGSALIPSHCTFGKISWAMEILNVARGVFSVDTDVDLSFWAGMFGSVLVSGKTQNGLRPGFPTSFVAKCIVLLSNGPSLLSKWGNIRANGTSESWCSLESLWRSCAKVRDWQKQAVPVGIFPCSSAVCTVWADTRAPSGHALYSKGQRACCGGFLLVLLVFGLALFPAMSAHVGFVYARLSRPGGGEGSTGGIVGELAPRVSLSRDFFLGGSMSLPESCSRSVALRRRRGCLIWFKLFPWLADWTRVVSLCIKVPGCCRALKTSLSSAWNNPFSVFESAVWNEARGILGSFLLGLGGLGACFGLASGLVKFCKSWVKPCSNSSSWFSARLRAVLLDPPLPPPLSNWLRPRV